MKAFRKVLFWLHLIAGVAAGVVVLVMSVTGTLLMYEKQMMQWADTHTFDAGPPAPGAARLPIEALITRVREQRPDVNAATVTLRADPEAPAAFAAGREGNLYVHAYTGDVLGHGSREMREFFRGVTDWHRWLAMSGDQRATGRSVTGASNLVFLILVVTGAYLWIPRVWNWRQFRNVLWFRGGLPGKARDFNWHNVIGIWSFLPLFIIVLSGVVISYPWAGNLVFLAVGEQPPARPGPGGPGGPGAPGGPAAPGSAGAAAARTAERRPESAPAEGRPRTRESVPVPVEGLNAAFARAEQHVAGWQTISLRLPGSTNAPVVFTIDRGTAGQPQKRGTLTLHRQTNEIVRWETYGDTSPGRQLRTWLRFAHTGEIYGLTGQTIAGVVSLGGAVLVYTGLFLALRRLLAWRQRRVARAGANAAVDREQQSAA